LSPRRETTAVGALSWGYKLIVTFALSGEIFMAKGQQRSNKESKKPKKDNTPPKPPGAGIEPVRTVTTAVIPRGKLKNK
jgi:hypothetical protein